MVWSCLLITLIKCLKGHKSLGSLCNVVKALIVSLVRGTEGQTMSPIELFWTAKKCKSFMSYPNSKRSSAVPLARVLPSSTALKKISCFLFLALSFTRIDGMCHKHSLHNTKLSTVWGAFDMSCENIRFGLHWFILTFYQNYIHSQHQTYSYTRACLC